MIKIKGLNELTKKLDDLSQRASELHGSHEVPLTELLTPAFLDQVQPVSVARRNVRGQRI